MVTATTGEVLPENKGSDLSETCRVIIICYLSIALFLFNNSVMLASDVPLNTDPGSANYATVSGVPRATPSS